ncbi:Methyltransferase-like protein 23 [Halocaridina rubra]|uniref:Methyltransferase-like protein 23 n=1 Tax=Halocaridina rubra TaxID=373956 RepID=A0AAN8XFP8_HALRR
MILLCFEDILVTVSYLLEHNPGAQFVCSYQERASDWSLEHLLHKWNLKCTQLPLSSFDADTTNIADSKPSWLTYHSCLSDYQNHQDLRGKGETDQHIQSQRGRVGEKHKKPRLYPRTEGYFT